MSGQEPGSIVRYEDPAVRPPGVVEEAETAVRRYGWKLTAVGGASAVGWLLGGLLGLYLPLHWVLLFLAALVAVFFHPLTRDQKQARRILDRWDEVRATGALAAPSDPRVELADSMAERVITHASVGERAREAARALTEKVRVLVADERRLRLLEEAGLADRNGERASSLSEIRDHLESRIADVLGRLAELHRNVVLRDAVALEGVVSDVEQLLRELEAEREVDELLAGDVDPA